MNQPANKTHTAILKTRSTQSVIPAIKENLYSFFKHVHSAMPVEFDLDQGLIVWKTKIPHPWFNAVLSTRLPGESADQLIINTLAWFASRQVAAISWWLATDVETTGWENLLSENGFSKDSNTPGMAAELDRLVEPKRISGFEIHLVQDMATLNTWVDTFSRGYGIPGEWTPALTEMIASLGFELPFSNYLGYLEGEPVAASTRFLGEGVAGIYNVATIEQARGKGIGTMMTVMPLIEARQMGYQWGILQSSQMGYGVYRRLGFEKLCDMEHFFREV